MLYWFQCLDPHLLCIMLHFSMSNITTTVERLTGRYDSSIVFPVLFWIPVSEIEYLMENALVYL